MEDHIYGRHEGLGIIQEQKVAIIGCGGIGSWIALYLGLAGVKEIDIYDSDEISTSNLNRFPLGPDKIGSNKAIAMAEHIQSLRPDSVIIPRQNFDPDIHSDRLSRYRWVVVTTDSLKSRKMIYDEVIKGREANGGYPGYVECGADGHHATVTFSPPEFMTSEEENPGYRSVPVWVGPCVMSAAMASYYILHGTVTDYERVHRVDWPDNNTTEGLVINTISEADSDDSWLNDDGVIDDAHMETELDEAYQNEGREADNEQAI